jgi:hypothetical protein
VAAVGKHEQGALARVLPQALAGHGVQTVEALALIPSSE